MRLNTYNKKVVIVTPVYKEDISEKESVSVALASKYLTAYQRVVVAPDRFTGNDRFSDFWDEKGYEVLFFKDKYFNGINGYNELMLSSEFYKKFVDYEYMLIYQLDALVLSDELESWLSKGYDYIGSPWVTFSRDLTPRLIAAGNGGFSLRRVQRFLEVLESKDFFIDEHKLMSTRLFAGIKYLLFISIFDKYPFLFKWINKKALFLFLYNENEDFFWAFFAKFFVKDFVVANAYEALGFAFEHHPGFCYGENNKELPLGAHGWDKYDAQFWEAHVPELSKII